MALVSPICMIPQLMIRYPDIAITGIMGSRSEIVEEVGGPVGMMEEEDKIYVSVGKDVKESESTLSWALDHFRGKKLCILHVHQPSKKIPIRDLGSKFPISQLEDHQVRAHHNSERQTMHKLLEAYRLICERAGVQAEKLHIERDSIEKGILELISQHGIRKLVMRAAADKHYSKKMMEPKSKKAISMDIQAPTSCHIWFVCKGKLIYTRQGNLDGVNAEVSSPALLRISNILPIQANSISSRSVSEGQNGLTISAPDFRRGRSAFSSPDGTGGVTPRSRLSTEGSSDVWDGISRKSASTNSRVSASSSSEVVEDSTLISFARTEGNQNGIDCSALPHSESFMQIPERLMKLYQEGSVSDDLYAHLEQIMMEAENSRKDAFEESIRCRKAEKDAIEAFRRVKASESSYAEELIRRKEIEEALARGKEEIENLKPQLDEVMEELRVSLETKSSLENQIRNSNQTVQELEQKIFSAVDLLQNYKKERDELQVERDNALSLAEELGRKQIANASTTHVTQFYSEVSFAEIEEATNNFDPSLKIGEGGYGSIYRGILRHTQVAIKMLHSHSSQGPSEFQQEVNVLSKLRHPNLVTLIGACPEAWILIYEYLPNGSLEDRLSCKDNTPPLSWQTRIRIAAELCSVLVFLHSCKPHSIIHGDLKPSNILLDSNNVSKLSDFGICRVISPNEFSSNSTTCCRTDPKGTFSYMDPEFLSTGELTRKSDVYSFGIILLRLLTGRPALGIAKDVQNALDKGNLNDLLDPTAGNWPFVQARQLAHLAISCCEMNRSRRPDFASEVWRMLEPMRVSCGASSFRVGSEVHCQIPPYFICPIFQEVMQDPVVASDGFTYEAEALKGWLDSGHDTSPMTNIKLSNTNILPNHALRSAIQEWLQQS